MEREEVLEKARKKVVIGEMEREKLNKSNWISVIVASIVALGFIIVFSILGRKECAFAIASICFTWASVFYFCQFFIAKRPAPILIGAILEGFGALIMITNFILTLVGVI